MIDITNVVFNIDYYDKHCKVVCLIMIVTTEITNFIMVSLKNKFFQFCLFNKDISIDFFVIG